MILSDPVTNLRGVGPELAKKFASLGIYTVQNLLEYYPRRYDDYSQIQPIIRIKPGVVSIKAVIKQAKGRYVRRGMHVTEAAASDETGSVRLVWFNQPYRATALKPNTEYYISGDFQLSYRRLSIMNPSVELASDFPINTARIVPVYRETKGLKSSQIRKIIRSSLPALKNHGETLPPHIIKRQKLMSYDQAVQTMHFPKDMADLLNAQKRLGFEEVFQLSLAALLNKHELLKETAIAVPFDEKLAKNFVGHLPFKLTDEQRKAIWQIYQDIQKDQPMNRLLEGDVGSGKTVVAAMAAVMTLQQDFQVALMAPTEILARQHAESLHELLEPLGMAEQLTLLVGGLKPAQKKNAQKSLATGKARFVVGTHALIQEKVNFNKLALVIIDEQHRFGVDERKKLQAKAGHAVHVLNMTATPIPRSLALTLYGELDITLIDSKPAGRKPIITKIISPNSRAQLYEKIDKELASGRQMFVVTALIKESDQLSVRAAEEVYKELSSKIFRHRRIGLLHGKLKPDEKDSIMQQFLNHELDILVATTVIEVGVNVPNATVMLIENADRFGLAQIHQLRGRVGRSHYQGYCFLITSDSSAPSRRLRALEQTNDGFRLAELDLEIRGPGAIYGKQQHGQLDLRVAKLTDTRLIAAARSEAGRCIDEGVNLLEYTQLYTRVQKLRAITNLN